LLLFLRICMVMQIVMQLLVAEVGNANSNAATSGGSR